MNIQYARKITQIIYLLVMMTTFLFSLKIFSILVLVSTIIGGVYFCGWFCPFGTAQEVMKQSSTILKIPQLKISKAIHQKLIFLRYIVFIVGIIGISYLFIIDARISFLSLLWGEKLSAFAYGFFGIAIILSLFISRPFCNYMCPEGARFGLLSSLRLFRIKRNKDTCIDCKRCDKSCPMHISISDKKFVHSAQCINCFACVSACPKKKTMQYRCMSPREIKEEMKKTYRKITKKEISQKKRF